MRKQDGSIVVHTKCLLHKSLRAEQVCVVRSPLHVLGSGDLATTCFPNPV